MYNVTKRHCVGRQRTLLFIFLLGTSFITYCFLQIYMESTLEADSFLVWSPSCQIPNIDPFHPSIRQYIWSPKPIVCSKMMSLTYIEKIKSKHNLIVNITALDFYGTTTENLNCCYSSIKRVTVPNVNSYKSDADNLFSVTPCAVFHLNITLLPEEEFLLVRCNSSSKKNIYTNVHALVPVKKAVAPKVNKVSRPSQQLSVMIVGIDSMSRLNLMRTMPKTADYLRQKGWVEMLGYNKVGYNTLPNTVAFLTGSSKDQLKKICFPNDYHKLDQCPFIWKDFSKQGYVTAFVEDEPRLSTYNFEKTGFVRQPTDYYIRPFMLAGTKHAPVVVREGLTVCIGDTSTTEHIFRYLLDYEEVFQNTSHFSITWINNFSHDNVMLPRVMDDTVQKFFLGLENVGALNNTLIMFLSDHGMRWGSIRNTELGWLEERLPFFYIWVPHWFRAQHPESYRNMENNRNRLVSPFDIYMTLRDVLNRATENKSDAKGSHGCPQCVSLFNKVPINRSCEMAGVPEEWCTCKKYRTEPTQSKQVIPVAIFIVTMINKQIENNPECATLLLDEVLTVRRRADVVHLEQPEAAHDDYIVALRTQPGGAVFEATVGVGDSYHLKGTISRINTYGNQRNQELSAWEQIFIWKNKDKVFDFDITQNDPLYKFLKSPPEQSMEGPTSSNDVSRCLVENGVN